MGNKKVMIVDDDKDFLEELRETLAMSGYEMIAVSDPLLVLNAASKEKPDIIVMDLKMPGKNGFQVADELRHVSQLMQVPIIAMTGNFKDEYDPLMKMCDISKCLRKPFNPLDIIAEIEGALE